MPPCPVAGPGVRIFGGFGTWWSWKCVWEGDATAVPWGTGCFRSSSFFSFPCLPALSTSYESKRNVVNCDVF